MILHPDADFIAKRFVLSENLPAFGPFSGWRDTFETTGRHHITIAIVNNRIPEEGMYPFGGVAGRLC